VRKALTLTLMLLMTTLSLSAQRVLAQNLTLYVFTDKSSYSLGDYVTIYGNLTKDGQPLPATLVAIQVENSTRIIALRTLQTEPPDIVYCPIYIWRVIPCDEWGNPQNEFPRPSPGGGSTAYFKVEYSNLSNETQVVLFTVNLFDATGISLGYSSLSGMSVLPRPESYNFTLPIPLTYDARLGTATVYTSAFTDWPKLNGTAYCPEKSAPLNITGTEGYMKAKSLDTPLSQGSSIKTAGENGTYNMTLRLHPYTGTDTYTVYAASQNENQTATATTTFYVTVKGDLNGDGAVDSTDLGILGWHWGALEGEPNYDPVSDLNGDGAIDSTDLGIMGIYWGYVS